MELSLWISWVETLPLLENFTVDMAIFWHYINNESGIGQSVHDMGYKTSSNKVRKVKTR